MHYYIRCLSIHYSSHFDRFYLRISCLLANTDLIDAGDFTANVRYLIRLRIALLFISLHTPRHSYRFLALL